MNKKIILGKIDYFDHGKKDCTAEVEITYKPNEDGKMCFSASGSIIDRFGRWQAGGQCLDTLKEYFDTPLFNEIYRLWNLYHLNEMHPECEHQRALGWREKATEKVTIYHFNQTHEAISEQRKTKERFLNALINGETVKASPRERLILNLNYTIKTHKNNVSEELAEFYKLNEKETEIKTLGWLKESQHPDGLLCKSCPVCGYKYGTSWQYMPIPKEDEKIILEIIGDVWEELHK